MLPAKDAAPPVRHGVLCALALVHNDGIGGVIDLKRPASKGFSLVGENRYDMMPTVLLRPQGEGRWGGEPREAQVFGGCG